ncbi:hypothetical protein JHL22_02525 [Advenella sp. WQ 585]|uniref:Uncharacterized protein n=1 Tax=Advenella mandrilli TaxID=2800330 RepID=A0ABS1EEA1_9BURK|nr:hypothetical protein [Advenella mandrilli]MBK1780087.1 hypothetical protein [Advenella mandrilli]
MSEFTVRTAEQFPILLQAFHKISADCLLQVLSLFGVELVLREASSPTAKQNASEPVW